MTRYCPHCWREVGYSDAVCPYCHQPTDDSDLPFTDRLIASLRHPEPTRAGLAIHILADLLHEQRAVAPLVLLLGQTEDRFLLDQAICALGTLGDKGAVPALARVLADTDAPFFARIHAATALGAIGGADATSALHAASGDVSPSVAAAVRSALAKLLDSPSTFCPAVAGTSGRSRPEGEAVAGMAGTDVSGPAGWHAMSAHETLAKLHSAGERGLDSQEAQARHALHGYNDLPEPVPTSVWRVLVAQVSSFIVLILIVAAIVSALLGDAIEAAAIVTIVAFNAVLGTMQERRSTASLAALRRLAHPTALVVREGNRLPIAARGLVPGDIVVLEVGNYVPADLRLLQSANLRTDESALTGKSTVVEKSAGVVLEATTPVADRRNFVYMGSLVASGRGRGVVVATGIHTEIGMTAQALEATEPERTPLQRRLDRLGRSLALGALAVCAAVFVAGALRGHGLLDMSRVAVSLAIAAVPEGLPAVVTVALVLGMREMVRRHALIRRLPAVETLGSTTAICSDKTGTLTEDAVTVTRLWAGGRSYTVSGLGYRGVGSLCLDGTEAEPADQPAAQTLLLAAALCSGADPEAAGATGDGTTYRLAGDPTEGAMVVAAAKLGMWRADLEAALPRVGEVPFDSERKLMSTTHELAAEPAPALRPLLDGDCATHLLFGKGVPEVVLRLCDSWLTEGERQPLSASMAGSVMAIADAMAGEALRVLAVAARTLPASEADAPGGSEHGLTLLGLIGMLDPPRPAVREAIRQAQGAGISTYMITGDCPVMAMAIAHSMGLGRDRPGLLTGAELDALDDARLDEAVRSTSVFARVTPQHKLRILESLKRLGHVVAMTGDGVNDALSLKRADIGIAMGITGTDVAKETAAMVITNDNYASIVAAVEQGRVVCTNIRKLVYYLLSCNVGEILVILIGAVSGWGTPLTAIQLLWLNLLTDGAPAMALAVEPGEPGVMEQPPRSPSEPVITRAMLTSLLAVTFALTAVTLAAFDLGVHQGGIHLGRSMAFVTLALAEPPLAYTARSERQPVLGLDVLGNRWMLWALPLSVVLVLAAVYLPFLQRLLGLVPLASVDWEAVLPLALVPAGVAEATKAVLARVAGRRGRLPSPTGEQRRRE